MSGAFGSSQWAYSIGVAGYQIEDSLRFEDGSSAYLNRTPASAGNRKTWTWSAWVKRGNLGSSQMIFAAHISLQDRFNLRFESSDSLRLFSLRSNALNWNYVTTQVFRDVGAWYHITLVLETDNATASDRVRLYVNGERVASFSSATNPSSGYAGTLVNYTDVHQIGTDTRTGAYFDGYLSDINFIDGQALDPTDFGETIDGYWRPIPYAGTYGTNGFHLDFNGNTNDASGNGNDWTANNISAHDYVPDSPTNNFAVMNPLDKDATWTLSEGNLKVSLVGTAGDNENIASTMAVPNSELIYFEAKPNNNFYGCVGIAKFGFAESNPFGGNVGSTFLYLGGGSNAKVYVDGSVSFDTGATWSLDIIGVAVDMSNSKVWFSKNGTYLGSGTQNPETNTGGFSISPDEVMPYAFKGNSNVTQSFTFNFGQDSTFAGATTAGGNTDDNGIGDFAYAPPAGFLSLCSANLPTPTIVDGSEHFNTVLYTGNGTSQSITSVNHQPDLVWIKERSQANDHVLIDSVRGISQRLESNNTDAEVTMSPVNLITSIDTDGFSLGSNTNANESSQTYAAWNWKAGGTAVSNTAGSITSQVSANVDAGFSIVEWTYSGSNGTVGHGLGRTVDMVITKDRGSGASNWVVWHKDLGDMATGYYLNLNNTNASSAYSTLWGQSSASSTTFGQGSGLAVSGSQIAYCFANSDTTKVGSYTGNGSTDGPMVFTGGRVQWLMIKRADSTGNWYMWDDKRHPGNDVDNVLYADASNAESVGSSYGVDFLSNGFKVRHSGTDINASGGTFIYLAILESPLKFATAR